MRLGSSSIRGHLADVHHVSFLHRDRLTDELSIAADECLPTARGRGNRSSFECGSYLFLWHAYCRFFLGFFSGLLIFIKQIRLNGSSMASKVFEDFLSFLHGLCMHFSSEGGIWNR